jgi:hypothetical protein
MQETALQRGGHSPDGKTPTSCPNAKGAALKSSLLFAPACVNRKRAIYP